MKLNINKYIAALAIVFIAWGCDDKIEVFEHSLYSNRL